MSHADGTCHPPCHLRPVLSLRQIKPARRHGISGCNLLLHKAERPAAGGRQRAAGGVVAWRQADGPPISGLFAQKDGGASAPSA